MAVQSPSKNRRKPQPHALHKPRGVVHPRVQAVGPEHFAFVCVDCAKARSKIMFADFYGRVLLEPTTVEHNRSGFDTALKSVRDAMARHHIKDVIVVVERTGRYHGPVQRAFRRGGVRGPHRPPLHHQAVSTPRRPRQQDRRHRPLRHPSRRRQRLRPVGARTRPGLRPAPTAGPAPPRPGARSASPSSSRCSNIFNRSCQDTRRCVADVFDSPAVLWVARDLGSAAAIVQAGAGRLEPAGSAGRPARSIGPP